jgi:hypothetical protein
VPSEPGTAPSVDKAKSISHGGHARPRALELLLRLTFAKLNKLEAALEKVWIAHVVIAGMGVATVFHVGKIPELIFNRFFNGEYDPKTVAVIIMASHLYYFMKTGHLLTAFNDAKDLRDELFEGYLTGLPWRGKVSPLRRTTSFLAAVFYPHTEGISYFIVTAVVVSLAQASSLYLVVNAYHASAMLTFVLCVLFILYYLFWHAQRDRLRATWAVGVLWALTALWFFLAPVIVARSTG